MRMARVNITVPDELLSQARAVGLNVSRLAAAAAAEELDRLAKIAELDAYLAELDAELGPLGDQEIAAAREWADQLAAGVTISAADAIVAAHADTCTEPLVLTSDAADLTALAGHTRRRITVARV